MPMSSEQRAMAVRALRAAADKLEAGEDVETFRYCPEDGYTYGCEDLFIDPEEYIFSDDEWYMGVESASWGVQVDVEALRVTDIKELYHTDNDTDEFIRYSQVELLNYTRPEPVLEVCDGCYRCEFEKEEDEE